MSDSYRIGDFSFDPKLGEIYHKQEKMKIRHKTAELLLFLLQADGRIVSKTELLDEVWSGTVVDEHVIFQSITELRKLFGDLNVIKTHPRKGYSIVEKVEIVKNQTESSPKPLSKQYKLVASLFVLVIAFVSAIAFFKADSSPHENQDYVLVLPTQNRLFEGGHQWVRYGAMDYLISSLERHESIKVFQVDYALELLQNANIESASYDREAINKLFEISGATLIVEQELSGSVTDYQLVYTLHQRNKTNRGAVFSEQINDVIYKVALKVYETMGLRPSEKNASYQTEFANEMLAGAIDKISREQYDQAESLLEAVLTAEPANLTAQRFLASSLVYQGKYAEAIEVTTKAIPQSELEDSKKELVRLLLWQAIGQIQLGFSQKGLEAIERGEKLAAALDDRLYMGKLLKVKGKILQNQKQFSKAKSTYEQSLFHYRSVQCSYGQADIIIDQGELLFVQKEYESAMQKFSASLAFSTQKQIARSQNIAQSWINKTQNKLSDMSRGN